ncbi:DUF947-domain-containing protein [Trametopsis cervina]|nr:DUF947-domain-containing protein [Trametopsis cervina]
MPRRPRPASRRLPLKGSTARQEPSTLKKHPVKPKNISPPPQEEESSEEESEEESPGPESDSGDDSEEEEEYADADAPRVALWEGDDMSEAEDDWESEVEDEQSVAGPSNIQRLQEDLSSLPLGTLRKAQQALARAKTLHESDESNGEDEEDEDAQGSAPEEEPSRSDAKESKKEKEKREIAKRAHKHAPMEVTSKRPVPRKKPNIEESRPIPRDPRFLPTSGPFSDNHFRSQYGFLSDLHLTELSTLRENLKRARKMLTSSPRDLRQEREAEVGRLERALKRAESTVNKDKKEKIEESAMNRVRKEEQEKRKQGKGAWFMKDADKKELFARAKFEALAESGGRGAVRKAIEKKQKKVDQKEKKRRPFAPGQAGKRPNPERHTQRERDGGWPNKRARVA